METFQGLSTEITSSMQNLSVMYYTVRPPVEEFKEDDLPLELLELKPKEPENDECCRNNCAQCIFEIYGENLERWKKRCQEYLIETGMHENVISCTERVIFPDKYSKFVLLDIIPQTKNCNIYRFLIPGNGYLGFKIGWHLTLRGYINEEPVTRKYTPISLPTEKGYFDLLIKTYDKGLMSQYICTWQTGCLVEWRGPFGSFEYKPNTFQKVVMIAGGTGIAPMIQIIHTIVKNEDDETFIRLLFACRTYDDILLKTTLDSLKIYWNFTVVYFLSQEKNKTKKLYGDEIHYGRIDEDALLAEIPTVTNFMFLICGSEDFNDDMSKFLCKIGVGKDVQYLF